jgi:membrane-bound lytic murein transglycosylase D
MRARATWRLTLVGIGALAVSLCLGCGVSPERIVGLLDGQASGAAERAAPPPRRSRYDALLAMGLSEADLAAAREMWPEIFPDSPNPLPYSGPDLWDRIRARFALPSPQRREVQAQVGWFARNPAYLDGASKRAQPYLYHIVNQVEARGMPSEIALLPVIESAFQPFARSPAEAVGLWQFIPETGRRFGLRQGPQYDARRDVFASTNAALDYLQGLHRQFGGDWFLALAAYNWGEGNVARAVQDNRRRGKPADFWSLSLPEETRTYVPRLIGLARVVAQPTAHGVALAAIPNRPYITRVPLDRPVDLALASAATGLSVSALRHLNPGYSGALAGSEGERHIVLPIDRADAFRARLRSG